MVVLSLILIQTKNQMKCLLCDHGFPFFSCGFCASFYDTPSSEIKPIRQVNTIDKNGPESIVSISPTRPIKPILPVPPQPRLDNIPIFDLNTDNYECPHGYGYDKPLSCPRCI